MIASHADLLAMQARAAVGVPKDTDPGVHDRCRRVAAGWLAGSPIPTLLKQEADWLRLNAKQELKLRDKQQVETVLTTWLPSLDKDDPNYEHHRLEALWTYQTISTTRSTDLARALPTSPDHRVRAAAAPVLYHWLAPSNKIKEGYRMSVIITEDGDAYSGTVVREDDRIVLIRNAVGQENRILKSKIESRETSGTSMMPSGLTANLPDKEFLNLIAYLSSLGRAK